MTNQNYIARIERVMREVQRFTIAADQAQASLAGGDATISVTGNRYTAAMRRASLDLTRALADLRQGR